MNSHINTMLCRLHATSHLQQLWGQVLSIIDVPVHGDELLWGGLQEGGSKVCRRGWGPQPYLVFHIGVVQAGIQHDNSKADNIASIYGQYTTKLEVTGTIGYFRL